MSLGRKDVTRERIPRCQAIPAEGGRGVDKLSGKVDVPPKRADVKGVAESANEEGESGAEHCGWAERVRKQGTTQSDRTRGGLTVGDTTGYETDDGKAAVEDTVCGV